MLKESQHCVQFQQSAKGNNNSAQLSTQIDQFYPVLSSQSSKNSKKQKDGFAYSTDEEEGAKESSDSMESMMIYGQKMLVDFHSEASINFFLSEIQNKKNLSQLTKESLKLVVLEKAVNLKKELRPLLQDAYQKYENMVLKSIFN